MWKGTIASINVAVLGASPMQEVAEAEAVPGRGLAGDRYFGGKGGDPKKLTPEREVTLIEAEAIEALARDYGIALAPRDARRNLVTRGVPLNHLVGREFRVGAVRLRGIRLCEPCEHLERLCGAKLRPGLVHRGGLRAQILTGGTIRAGDEIGEIGP